MSVSTPAARDFRRRFTLELHRALGQVQADNRVQSDNWAGYRYGPEPAEPAAADIGTHVGWHEYVLDHCEEFSWAEQRLADLESRAWLMRMLLFRCLGHTRVRLPVNTPAYRAFVGALGDSPPGVQLLERLAPTAQGKPRARYRVEATGIALECSPGHLINGWCNHLGVYARGGVEVRAQPGDVVVEGGAATGLHTLRLAAQVGELGRVYAFEFLPSNVERLVQHCELNPSLAQRIELVEHAIGARPGVVLAFTPEGNGTRVGAAGSHQVAVQSIDGLVAERALPRVDFVALDVEGAEGAAIQGAARSLERWRPRLAIAAYHKPDDFYALMRAIDAIVPGYEFHLEHHTIHAEETFLYGVHRV